MANAFTVDRRTASQLLNISERTLDRYIRSGRLDYKKIGRKVLLSEKALQKLSNEMGQEEAITQVDIVEKAPKVETTKMIKVGDKDIFAKTENIVYKSLYEKATIEIEKKNDDLRMLNYKLGQIETQMKNTIPMIEFKKTEDSLSKIKQEHHLELEEKNRQLEDTMRLYNTEKVNKYVYLSLLVAFSGIAVVVWAVQQFFLV
jgi:excisionase family DNA binding protein